MKNIFSILLIIAAMAVGTIVEPQQPTKISRVGILGTEAKERKERIAQYLRELGYTEGRTLFTRFERSAVNLNLMQILQTSWSG
jgi:hypothetical protein